ncbi:hypothetical protein MTYP_03181 [Methylophilaceae bacterium]|nr:hypothetical protein MTYP_03181 [Methylophilaceae bacterium]
MVSINLGCFFCHETHFINKPFDDLGVNHVWIGKMQVPLANFFNSKLDFCYAPSILVLYEFNANIGEAINF